MQKKALAADTAAVMKLSATEGTVTVCNASARELTVKDDMRLYNGYTVETSATSYAWVNLDDTKLLKLDASTKVEVRKSGKKASRLHRTLPSMPNGNRGFTFFLSQRRRVCRGN